MTVTIHTGDCIEIMRSMPANSVDSVVTDPPYGIRFMGKAWDGADIEKRFRTADKSEFARKRNGRAAAAGQYDLAPAAMKAFQSFSQEWAAEALRVLKPGGYLLAFASARTYHRMACGVEDAGFEVRDQVLWIYGSGFPKSHNGEWGGTALKPAHEPIVMARKPLVGTVAKNWELYGTGALNIEGCRVDVVGEVLAAGAGNIPCRHDDGRARRRIGEASADRRYNDRGATDFAATPGHRGGDAAGRWPANVIHDGSAAVLAAFPDAPGQQRHVGPEHGAKPSVNTFGDFGPRDDFGPRGDSGSAARFFYCAKPSKAERDMGLEEHAKQPAGMRSNTSGARITARDGYDVAPRANNHPTVKPIALMRYLIRLVTPRGGTVLDAFCGSGSTGCGAVAEGFNFIGIEMDPHNVAIADARIAAVQPGLALGATA